MATRKKIPLIDESASLNVTGTVSLAGGGAATITFPTVDSTLLYSGGALGTPSSGDLLNCTFPTLNQNTTGTASSASNLIGGNNTTLLGAIPYQSGTNITTLLSPNTTTTKQFLSQTGNGTNGANPSWSAITASDISLGNVTNDAQTKSAVVPNTLPTSGQVLIGNAGGTAYAPTSMSGDVTLASTGTATVISGSTSTAGKLQLTDSTSSTSTTTAATPNSVKSAYDLANSKGNGTVTSASIVTANGFAGTVATATTTPAITLTTSVTGVLKGNGTAISAATAETDYVTPTGTGTLTNKRITKRVGSTTSSATPTINTDNVDKYSLTAQAVDITSFTTNLSGTPTDGQLLWIAITGTASRAITWGTSFEASTISLPTTTSGTATLNVGFSWNTATSKWTCVAVA